ncbi:hypothetical protein K466DRAFT_468577, partial [Polyporus arcularius HHB13444]
AVVSGSVALRFFLPDEMWSPGDMDIYVPDLTYDQFIAAVTDMYRLRFTPIPRKKRPPAGDDMDVDALPPGDAFLPPSMSADVIEVRQFITRTGKRVDVIRAPGNNPTVAINRFWSSLVMNFLRPDVCVSGYPSTTLARVGMLK